MEKNAYMDSLDLGVLRFYNEKRQQEWDQGEVISLEYLGNAIAGETGEACNVIKKIVRQRAGLRGSQATPGDLANELADIIIYADLIARKENIDLAKAVREKFNATSDKLGLATRLP
jgi:NTP pyrophosphatase (non-canonical NTP hydrolase)